MRRLALMQLVFALAALVAVLGAYGTWYVIVGKTSAEAAALAEQIRVKGEDSARIKAAQEALESLGEVEPCEPTGTGTSVRSRSVNTVPMSVNEPIRG